MGYDMRLRRIPDGEAEVVAVAREVCRKAVAARDAFPRSAYDTRDENSGYLRSSDPEPNAAQLAVEAAYDALNKAERSYFRLNIWGMSRCCEYMNARGMLCQPGVSRQWPTCPDQNAYEWVTYPDDRSHLSEPTPEQIGAAEAYAAELDRLLAEHPGECPGIPVHKFGSNDGWIVTPPECTAALGALALARGAGVVDPDEPWWPRWVEYLRLGAEYDGFEVY